MHKTLITLVIIVSALIFSGCATNVHSNVVRFHMLPPIGEQRSFVIVPSKEQDGSIEFATYANQIALKFIEYGWRAADIIDSDYAVFLSYGIGDGQTVSSSVPIFGQTGGGTSYTTGTVRSNSGGYSTYSGTTTAPPTFGQTGSIPITSTQYSRNLVMTILDARSLEHDKPKVVFEGRVKSRGSSGEISVIMPNMIEALFKKFPGESGKAEGIIMALIE